MLDIPETAKAIRQGAGRLRRPGQKADHVHAIYCVSDNPIDRFLIDICKEKANLTGKVLGETIQIMETLQGDLECRGLLPADNDAPVDKDASDKDAPGVRPIFQKKAQRGHGVITKTFSDENVTSNRKRGRSLSVEERLQKLAVKQEQMEDRLMDALDRQRHLDEKNVTDNEEQSQDAVQTSSVIEVTDNESEITNISEKQVTDVETEVTDITGDTTTTTNKKRRAAQWESQHPDKVRQQTAERVKRYRERHPEKQKEIMKIYRQEHKAESRAYMREYRKDNEDLKAKHREYMRAWRARQRAESQ